MPQRPHDATPVRPNDARALAYTLEYLRLLPPEP